MSYRRVPPAPPFAFWTFQLLPWLLLPLQFFPPHQVFQRFRWISLSWSLAGRFFHWHSLAKGHSFRARFAIQWRGHYVPEAHSQLLQDYAWSLRLLRPPFLSTVQQVLPGIFSRSLPVPCHLRIVTWGNRHGASHTAQCQPLCSETSH